MISRLYLLRQHARMRLTPAQTRETWLAARALRNRMVHDYIRNPVLLSQTVTEAHDCVPMLVRFVQACRAYAAARGLV